VCYGPAGADLRSRLFCAAHALTRTAHARRENPETKRRFHNLLVVSKLFDKLHHRHRGEKSGDWETHADACVDACMARCRE